MLSLAPRFDLFRFCFDKTFLNERITQQYTQLLNTDANVMVTPIDYLNESVVSVSIPGINDLLIKNSKTWFENTRTTMSVKNPLACIDKNVTVRFRMNQGMYNYFMMMEQILCDYHVDERKAYNDVFFLELLDERGRVTTRIRFIDCYIKQLEELTFTFNKIGRQTETFSLEFAFNNIDIDFVTDLN